MRATLGPARGHLARFLENIKNIERCHMKEVKEQRRWGGKNEELVVIIFETLLCSSIDLNDTRKTIGTQHPSKMWLDL